MTLNSKNITDVYYLHAYLTVSRLFTPHGSDFLDIRVSLLLLPSDSLASVESNFYWRLLGDVRVFFTN